MIAGKHRLFFCFDRKAGPRFRGAQLAVFYLPDALLLIGARGLWGFLVGRPPSPALSPLASDDTSRACKNSILLTVRTQLTNHGGLQSIHKVTDVLKTPIGRPSKVCPAGDAHHAASGFTTRMKSKHSSDTNTDLGGFHRHHFGVCLGCWQGVRVHNISAC